MDTLASYDQLPYDSLPLPETQPDFLAAVASLHGFDAPDPRRARILELGCAQGGNLIPLAWRWPEAECVGVELSRVQAAAGAAFVAALGLPNVRIVHGDLAALPDELGSFDYIIAHGVFSWVPPAVQQALLEVCRRHLSEQGVAYVSFNVTAGWDRLQPLRRALIERTATDLPAPERYRQALRVLDELETESTDPLLLDEIAYLKSAAPSYLFHEYLAEFSVPMGFDAFARQLGEHGLRYVGEAGPRHAVVELEDVWGLSPEGMMARWLDAEAALDASLDIRFRQALIARDDAPCAQPPQADALDRLAFYADVRSDDEIDLEATTEQDFIRPGGQAFPVSQPAMKAALIALSAAYPAALTYADLLAAAQQVMADFGVATRVDESTFREALFQQLVAHNVMPGTELESSGTESGWEPGERPCANALARLQTQSPGWEVSNTRHVAMLLDAPARDLLGLLDGTRSVDELAGILHAKLAETGRELAPEVVRERIHHQVWLFARQGLLT